MVQVVALGLLFDAQGTLVNIGVAIGASRAVRRISGLRSAQRFLRRVTGAVFIGLGLRVAFAD